MHELFEQKMAQVHLPVMSERENKWILHPVILTCAIVNPIRSANLHISNVFGIEYCKDSCANRFNPKIL